MKFLRTLKFSSVNVTLYFIEKLFGRGIDFIIVHLFITYDWKTSIKIRRWTNIRKVANIKRAVNATNIAVFCLESSYLASKKLLLKILNLELIFFYTQKTKYNYRSLFLPCIHHSYILKCISELSFILVSAFIEIFPRTRLKLRK